MKHIIFILLVFHSVAVNAMDTAAEITPAPSQPSLQMLISGWNLAEEHHLETFDANASRIQALQKAYNQCSPQEKQTHNEDMLQIYTTWFNRCYFALHNYSDPSAVDYVSQALHHLHALDGTKAHKPVKSIRELVIKSTDHNLTVRLTLAKALQDITEPQKYTELCNSLLAQGHLAIAQELASDSKLQKICDGTPFSYPAIIKHLCSHPEDSYNVDFLIANAATLCPAYTTEIVAALEASCKADRDSIALYQNCLKYPVPAIAAAYTKIVENVVCAENPDRSDCNFWNLASILVQHNHLCYYPDYEKHVVTTINEQPSFAQALATCRNLIAYSEEPCRNRYTKAAIITGLAQTLQATFDQRPIEVITLPPCEPYHGCLGSMLFALSEVSLQNKERAQRAAQLGLEFVQGHLVLLSAQGTIRILTGILNSPHVELPTQHTAYGYYMHHCPDEPLEITSASPLCTWHSKLMHTCNNEIALIDRFDALKSIIQQGYSHQLVIRMLQEKGADCINPVNKQHYKALELCAHSFNKEDRTAPQPVHTLLLKRISEHIPDNVLCLFKEYARTHQQELNSAARFWAQQTWNLDRAHELTPEPMQH